jgi:carbon-monoxide dehydrogenase medium subunit
MYDFDYQRPTSLDAALDALQDAQDGKLLAGGHTLLPTLKQRLARPSTLIDLAGIDALRGITVDGGVVSVGSMTTHSEVAGSQAVADAIPALAALAETIGDPQVRHCGTIGGSIANNDPAADYPGAVLGLGATVVTNAREIAADNFFLGLFDTALDDGEIITAVKFPVPQKACYMKFPQPASRFSLVGAFVAKTADGVRMAITGAGEEGVFRVAAMEAALDANFSADAIADIQVPDGDLNTDIHASAEYRAHLIGVMARRAVAACV